MTLPTETMTLPTVCPWCGASLKIGARERTAAYTCGSDIRAWNRDEDYQSPRCRWRCAERRAATLLEERDEFRKKWLEEQAARIEQAKFLDTYSAAKAERQIRQLTIERDEAREAARWLLPFTINTPHTATAISRWPWLEDIEA